MLNKTLLLLLASLACSCYGQALPTAIYPGRSTNTGDFPVAGNLAATTLSQTIGAADTIIPVVSTSSFPAPTGNPWTTLVQIDTTRTTFEIVRVCGSTPVTFVVCTDGLGGRGYDGTSAQAHNNGAAVNGYLAARPFNQIESEIIAIQQNVPAIAQLPFVVSTTKQFTQTPGGALTGGVPATVTLAPCPSGVNGSDVGHYVYLSGGVGTAEPPLITGGTCTSSLASGTLTFTPQNSHSGAWTISSATAGIQESIQVLQSGGAGGSVRIPAGSYTIYAPCRIASNSIWIVGSGFGTTGVVQNTANADGFDFIPAAGTNQYNGIRDLSIGSVGGGSSSVGLNTTSQSGFISERVRIYSFQTGVNINSGIAWTGRDLTVQILGTGTTSVGFLVQGATTNQVLLDNISTPASVQCASSVQIITSGNTAINNSTLTGCQNSLLLSPGANQVVASTDLTATYLDHAGSAGGGVASVGLNINPTAATGSVVRTRCTQCWISSSAGTGILVQGLGTVDEILVHGSEVSGNSGNGIQINSGLSAVSNVRILNSNLFNNAGSAFVSNFNTLANITLSNNHIGNNATGWGAGSPTTVGINANYLNTGQNFTGNIFESVAAPINVAAQTFSGPFTAANNGGVDDVTGTVASAASITRPINSVFTVTGTTQITTMLPAWSGAHVRMIFTNATPGGVGATGNFYVAKTVTQNQVLDCVFDGTGGKWACTGP